MEHLDEISVVELQEALDSVEEKKPAERLIAAIAYKNGITQTELAKWYGVQRRTIYSWLKRLEEAPLEQAVSDEHRPGRPRKLSAAQQNEFEATLHEPPTETGYDSLSWTPALVRQYLRETFEVEYSLPSCRRLMRDAGLQYQPSSEATRSQHRGSDDTLESNDGGWVPE